MKITVLAENLTFTDEHFFGEPGPSYWVEVVEKNILFDTGFLDLYLKNAKKLHVDLSTADAIVLSHGHNDHATSIKHTNVVYGGKLTFTIFNRQVY